MTCHTWKQLKDKSYKFPQKKVQISLFSSQHIPQYFFQCKTLSFSRFYFQQKTFISFFYFHFASLSLSTSLSLYPLLLSWHQNTKSVVHRNCRGGFSTFLHTNQPPLLHFFAKCAFKRLPPPPSLLPYLPV